MVTKRAILFGPFTLPQKVHCNKVYTLTSTIAFKYSEKNLWCLWTHYEHITWRHNLTFSKDLAGKLATQRNSKKEGAKWGNYPIDFSGGYGAMLATQRNPSCFSNKQYISY